MINTKKLDYNGARIYVRFMLLHPIIFSIGNTYSIRYY